MTPFFLCDFNCPCCGQKKVALEGDIINSSAYMYCVNCHLGESVTKEKLLINTEIPMFHTSQTYFNEVYLKALKLYENALWG